MSSGRIRVTEDELRGYVAQATIDILAAFQAGGGLCAMAIAIDGMLEGIDECLVDLVGPEKAYERMQRSCDALAHRVADDFIARAQGNR